MKNSNILIAIATYKEAENIVKLIQQIRIDYPKLKILVINDFSNDGTREALDKLKDKNLIFLERPTKLGLGTAHKLSIFYAIKFQYDYLLTMDADLSHEPKSIPELLNYADKNNFVIGSRFCEGGKTDLKGFRKIISSGGNFFAKKLLNIKLNEITTYFRVYSVELLKQLPYDELNAQGYSLGVKLVWLMKKLNANLVETPIHFRDRNKGQSKIPKLQVFISFFDCIKIKLKDILIEQKFYKSNPTFNFQLKGTNCKENCFFSLNNKIYKCLVCNKINNEKY